MNHYILEDDDANRFTGPVLARYTTVDLDGTIHTNVRVQLPDNLRELFRFLVRNVHSQMAWMHEWPTFGGVEPDHAHHSTMLPISWDEKKVIVHDVSRPRRPKWRLVSRKEFPDMPACERVAKREKVIPYPGIIPDGVFEGEKCRYALSIKTKVTKYAEYRVGCTACCRNPYYCLCKEKCCPRRKQNGVPPSACKDCGGLERDGNGGWTCRVTKERADPNKPPLASCWFKQ